MRSHLVPLIAPLFAVALVACGDDTTPTDAGNGDAPSGVDGPVIRHLAGRDSGGDDAFVGGRLVVEGECLYLDLEGAERFPVVWPHDTRWDAEAGTVVLADGTVAAPGTMLSGGGGYHRLAAVERAAGAAAAELAGRCVDNTHGEIALVNNQPSGIGIDPAVDGDEIGQPAGPDHDAFSVGEATPIGVAQLAPAPGVVRLWVSNQSFADDPVGLTITVDGHVAVAADFFVEGHHNWIAYDIDGLEAGSHTLAAESDTGGELEATFTVVDGEPRWLLVDYWHGGDGPEGPPFTFAESDIAIGFD